MMSVISDRYSFISAIRASGDIVFRDQRETFEVGKKHRHVAGFAAEHRQLVRRQHVVDHIGGEVQREALLQQPAVLVGDHEAIADHGGQRGEPGNERLAERQHQRVVEGRGGADQVNRDRAEKRQHRAGRLEHSRDDGRKRRDQRRDQRDRQPAEFDGRIAGDQVVDGGGMNIDAGDVAALEADADRLLRQRAARRPRALDPGGESLRRQLAILRSPAPCR